MIHFGGKQPAMPVECPVLGLVCLADRARSMRRAVVSWRASRIERFAERQEKARQWVPFRALVAAYARNVDEGRAFHLLSESLLAGEFEQKHRSRVLYLNPQTAMAKLTRQRLQDALGAFGGLDAVAAAYLAHCWVPVDMAAAWGKAHGLDVGTAVLKRGRKQRNSAELLNAARLLLPRVRSKRETAQMVLGERGGFLACGFPSQSAAVDWIRRRI
jgi:hypothetical protein